MLSDKHGVGETVQKTKELLERREHILDDGKSELNGNNNDIDNDIDKDDDDDGYNDDEDDDNQFHNVWYTLLSILLILVSRKRNRRGARNEIKCN